MITNMVSEQYHRDEDDDVSASDSANDEDEESVGDEVPTISAQIQENSASHNRIVLAVSILQKSLDLNLSIEPESDGISIEIGKISCVLVDSCRDIVNCDDSVFGVYEDEKLKFLEPELKN